MIIQTIGTNLRRMDDKTNQTNKKGLLNTIVVWITLLMIGIALGYIWHTEQTKNFQFVHPSQWTNEIKQETFVPYEILGTNKPAHLQ